MTSILPLRIALVGFGLVAAAVLSGCTAAPAPCTGTCKVDMKTTAFAPKEIKVKVGSTVEWTNRDTIAHDVTNATGSALTFQSEGGKGGMNPNEVWSFKFDTAGTYKYYCTLHAAADASAGMVGTITVVA